MSAETLPSKPDTSRVFKLYHFYRLVVGIFLVLLAFGEFNSQLLQFTHGQLFRATSWFYLLLNILIIFTVRHPRHPPQIFSLALTDIILLIVLFYAGGGIPSGIGSLLVIAVAIANALLRGHIGLLLAAIAAAGIIYLTFYLNLNQSVTSDLYIQAGTLGALCFIGALFTQALTRRLRLTEHIAEQRAADVANLEELNAQILQRLRTGILVLTPQRRILLINQVAKRLLGQEASAGKSINAHYPELVKRLQQWQQNSTLTAEDLPSHNDGPALQLSFISLPHGKQQRTLVFLEDSAQIAQEAQQLKLASLGRLTAGIAHEIRNPLGAISHAAQLLQESDELSGPDKRLTQIIQDQSARLNLIIENVLQLSRGRKPEPHLLDLKYRLYRFVHEFHGSAQENRLVHLEVQPDVSLQTRMDPNQLTQVLMNLVQNGLRYSAQKNGIGQVWLKLAVHEQSGLPILDIIDDGPGISPDQAQHIFEPFFTTDDKGTGLGLYISRELCQSNRARLDYRFRPEGGCCFRITFAQPHIQTAP